MLAYIVTNARWNIIRYRRPLIELLKKNYNVKILVENKPRKEFFDNNQIKIINKKYNFIIIREIKILISFFRVFKKNKPEIIYSFTTSSNLYSSICSKILDINHAMTITGLGQYLPKKNSISFFYFKIIKIFHHKKKIYIFQNYTDRNYFMKKINLNIDHKVCKVVSGSYKLNKIIPDEFNTKKRFIFVSRLLKEKGIDDFFKIVKEYDNFNFSFYAIDEKGPNSLSQEYIKKSANNYKNLEIFFNKIINIKDLSRYSGIIFLSKYGEGLPLIFIESAEIGLPFICHKSKWLNSKLIKLDNVFLLNNKNNNLLNVLTKIYNFNEYKRNEIYINCKSKFDEYFDIKKTESIYLKANELIQDNLLNNSL